MDVKFYKAQFELDVVRLVFIYFIKERLKFSDHFLSQLLHDFWVRSIPELIFPVLWVKLAARSFAVFFMLGKKCKGERFTEVWMDCLIELIGLIDNVLNVEYEFLECEWIRAENSFESHWNHPRFDHLSCRVVNDNGRNKAENNFEVLISAQCWYKNDNRVHAVHETNHWEYFAFGVIHNLIDEKTWFYYERNDYHDARK